jgi:hypothetical protein
MATSAASSAAKVMALKRQRQAPIAQDQVGQRTIPTVQEDPKLERNAIHPREAAVEKLRQPSCPVNNPEIKDAQSMNPARTQGRGPEAASCQRRSDREARSWCKKALSLVGVFRMVRNGQGDASI